MIAFTELWLLFQLYVIFVVVNAETTGKLNGDLRIVGGTDANAFPTLAFSKGSRLCGATLIYSDILLTAAHCAGVFIESGIYLGGNTADGAGSLSFGVTKEFPHPGYDTVSDANDIMLVKLSAPSTISPIKINFDPQFPPDSVDSKVIGYGATSEGGSSSFVLQEASIPIVPYDQCDSFWNKLEATTQICTGLPDGLKDSCQGDSGGPLLVNDIQVGIVSFGLGCARANTPSVYTRVSGYQQFIESGICDLSSNPPATCNGSAPFNIPVTAPTKLPLRTPTTVPILMPTAAPFAAPFNLPMTTAIPVDSSTALPVRTTTIAPATIPTASPVDPPLNIPLSSAVPVAVPVTALSSAPTDTPNATQTIAPIAAPVENPTVDRTNPPSQAPIAAPNSPTVVTSTFAPAGSTTMAPVRTITNSPIASPNASPKIVSTQAPTKLPLRTPIGMPSTFQTPVPLINPISQTLPAPIKSPIATPGPAPSEAPVDASSRSSSPVVLPVLAPSNAPKIAPVASPVVSPIESPATTPRTTPVIAPSSAIISTTASPQEIAPIVAPTTAVSPAVVPSIDVPVSYPQSSPVLRSPASTPIISPVIVAAAPNVEKKGMNKKKGMKDRLTDDEYPVLAPSKLSNGMKKQKGRMRKKLMRGQQPTDDDIDITVFLKLNSTLNTGGMSSLVKGKQNSGSNSMGSMMMNEIDTTSTAAPSVMRMSRIGKNCTSPSKALQSIMEALHSGKLSVHNIDNNATMPMNKPEQNSTIGALLERFRKNINQGLHLGSNNTAGKNNGAPSAYGSNNDTDSNENRYPRLSDLWEKLVERFGLEQDTNQTKTVIREWFYGKH